VFVLALLPEQAQLGGYIAELTGGRVHAARRAQQTPCCLATAEWKHC